MHNTLDGLIVLSCRRLVNDEDFWSHRQYGRDSETLALTLAQEKGIFIGIIEQIDSFQGFACALTAFCRFHTQIFQPVLDLVFYFATKELVIWILEYVTNRAGQQVTCLACCHILSQYLNTPLRC